MMYAIIDERGAVFGPFHSTIEASTWAEGRSDGSHLWRLVRLNRPETKKS